jgi:hypothetical protein
LRHERDAGERAPTKFFGHRLPIGTGGRRFDLPCDELRAHFQILLDARSTAERSSLET